MDNSLIFSARKCDVAQNIQECNRICITLWTALRDHYTIKQQDIQFAWAI